MADYVPSPYESGSHWRRWDPHIHAPGTLLYDQFNGDWDNYLKAIESATPAVEVLGVTDYLCIESYKEVRADHQNGRLPKVKLLFPNVEFRLTVEIDKRKGINLHLLFCPEDGDHVEQIERALSMLSLNTREVRIVARARTSCSSVGRTMSGWKMNSPPAAKVRTSSRLKCRSFATSSETTSGSRTIASSPLRRTEQSELRLQNASPTESGFGGACDN